MSRLKRKVTYACLALGAYYYFRSLLVKRTGVQVNVRVSFDKIHPKTPMVKRTSNHLIKGNKNSRGERIYHTPGGRYYDDLIPTMTFASEAEAKKAGYRKSRR